MIRKLCAWAPLVGTTYCTEAQVGGKCLQSQRLQNRRFCYINRYMIVSVIMKYSIRVETNISSNDIKRSDLLMRDIVDVYGHKPENLIIRVRVCHLGFKCIFIHFQIYPGMLMYMAGSSDPCAVISYSRVLESVNLSIKLKNIVEKYTKIKDDRIKVTFDCVCLSNNSSCV